MELFDRVVDRNLFVRRINICANHLVQEDLVQDSGEQLTLFADHEALEKEKADLAKERNRQEAILSIRKRFGKNVILRGMNSEEDATAKERNRQIGGHKA